MKYIRFPTTAELIAKTASLIREHMQIRSDTPHAVMLSGGRTPLPAYESIASAPFPVSPDLHVMVSDERMVPEDSADNNSGHMAPMISALRIPSGRVLKVRTTLGLPEAADRYDSEIRDFFRKKGRLTLALLGLGADGHTASLFSAGDLDRCKDRFAIPVPGAGPFNRVSVTPAVIRQAGRIVFLVAGNEKEEIAARLRSKPETVIAGQVVKNAPNVELWFSS